MTRSRAEIFKADAISRNASARGRLMMDAKLGNIEHAPAARGEIERWVCVAAYRWDYGVPRTAPREMR